MPFQIPRWLIKPKIWSYVCFGSSIVGLLCYALSSSFNHLFGCWTWWKILLYSVFCLIICTAILLAKKWQSSNSNGLGVKAHLAFLVLIITCLYSFFYDKVVKGKPDAYSLISCAAFAVMSLSLSMQTHCGVEIDLQYFFSTGLTLQLMKINLWLVIVGASFCYFLIILRSSLAASLERDQLPVQDQAVNSDSLETNTGGNAHLMIMPQEANTGDSAPMVMVVTTENGDIGLQFQQQLASRDNQDNIDIGVFRSRLIACIEDLKEESWMVIPMVSRHLGPYLDFVVDSETMTIDVNLLRDTLPLVLIDELHEAVKLMVLAGFEKECCHLYSSCRVEFLQECLLRYRLMEFNMVGVGLMEKIESWKEAFSEAVKILLPMEKILSERLFGTLSSKGDIFFTEVCRELAIRLMSFANAFINESHLPDILSVISKVDETISEVLGEFESLLSDPYSVSIKNELHVLRKRMGKATLGIFTELESIINGDTEEQATIPPGKSHPLVFRVMNTLLSVSKFSDVILREVYKDFSRVPDREGKSSFSIQITKIIDLLISNLEAKSKNYTHRAMGYVFRMNNLSYIRQQALTLGFSLDSELLAKLTMKVQQNLELYKSSSWNKLVDFLKLEGNVAVETLKEKLHLFNLHFQGICNDQSTWIVFDNELREEIIKSIENILLPAYGNFIDRFHNVVGRRAYKYIVHGMVDIQDGLNLLFSEPH